MVDGTETERLAGKRVGRRLRQLRTDRRLTLSQLEARLATIGHPLQLSVISKIENGQRRMDVNDLLALSLALDVSPNTILLSAGARASATVQLTAARAMTEAEAWAWAMRDSPQNVDQEAPVVILTSLNVEYAAVRNHLSGIEKVSHPSGTLFEVGVATGSTRKIALTLAGAGNMNAAIVAERAAATFQPSAIFFVGVAGGLGNRISPGDVVVGTRIYMSEREIDTDKVAVSARARPRAWEAPHQLEQVARYVATVGTWSAVLGVSGPSPAARVHFGPIWSADGVLGSRPTREVAHLRRMYDDAIAIEMEAYGAQAAHMSGSPSLTIRGISDKADARKTEEVRFNAQQVAASRAAAFAVAVVAEIAESSA